MAIRHKYVGVILFLYRFLWGFFLFRLLDSVVTPVLARYPDLHPNADAIPLFLIEAEFRILRTDLVDPLLWLLAGLLLIRMALTPLIQAGLFYSFHHSSREGGTAVLLGVRKAWKPVMLLYVSEKLLILLPGLWILPRAKERFFSAGSMDHWVGQMLPYAAVWLVWGFLLHLVFQAMQFGAVSGDGIAKGAVRAAAQSVPLLSVSLIMAGCGLAAAGAVSAVSLIWSGFVAVLLHQSFHLVRTLLHLWTFASQFAVWRQPE